MESELSDTEYASQSGIFNFCFCIPRHTRLSNTDCDAMNNVLTDAMITVSLSNFVNIQRHS